MKTRSQNPAADILRGILLFVMAVLFLLPFYLILRNALLPEDLLTSLHWAWLPAVPHWENFRELFQDPDAHMLSGLANSAVIAIVTLVFQTLFSSMAGYALARIPALAGFGSDESFRRHFRLATGVSPQAYRRQFGAAG